mmetsp:Transcript_107097/g.228700  ORF Transcript_107097/g.228700 Transcript_107097/m.228700 type:complete len:207 (-) Transcript_107097:677-1297(-)
MEVFGRRLLRGHLARLARFASLRASAARVARALVLGQTLVLLAGHLPFRFIDLLWSSLHVAALRKHHTRRQVHDLHHRRLLRCKGFERVRKFLLLGPFAGPSVVCASEVCACDGAARPRRSLTLLAQHRILLAGKGWNRNRIRKLVELQGLDPDDVPTAIMGERLVLHLILHLRKLGRFLGLIGGLFLQARFLVASSPGLSVLDIP